MKKILVIIAIIIFAAVSVFVAITNSKSDNSSDDQNVSAISEISDSTLLYIDVNGLPLYIDLSSDDVWYDLQQMTTEFDMPFTIGELYGYDIYINGIQTSGNTTLPVKIEKISKILGINIKLIHSATGVEKNYYIRTLNQNAPNFTVIGKSDENGYYYFTNANFIFKLDSNGDIVYYRQDCNVVDFKAAEIDGKRYYSYLSYVDNVIHPTLTQTYATTKAIVMDENYQVIDTVEFLSTEQGMPEMHSLGSHEFTVLGEKHYLLTSYVGKLVHNLPDDVSRGNMGARVLASVFQEIDNGELVFQWDSTEHPELYSLSNEQNDYYNKVLIWSDYAHMNSVEVDPSDGNYICSFRHFDAVIKISRETGNAIWILGGSSDQFGLSETQKMHHQHFARISGEGRITIFDNHTAFVEDTDEDSQSRVVEYTIDEDNKTLIDFKEYVVPGKYSSIMGSAQRLDTNSNRFLICWGGRDSGSALFSEIDFDSHEILFEAVYQHNSYVDDTYRAYKFSF